MPDKHNDNKFRPVEAIEALLNEKFGKNHLVFKLVIGNEEGSMSYTRHLSYSQWIRAKKAETDVDIVKKWVKKYCRVKPNTNYSPRDEEAFLTKTNKMFPHLIRVQGKALIKQSEKLPPEVRDHSWLVSTCGTIIDPRLCFYAEVSQYQAMKPN